MNGRLLRAAAYLQANNPSASSGGAINKGGDENFVAKRLRALGASDSALVTVLARRIGAWSAQTQIARREQSQLFLTKYSAYPYTIFTARGGIFVR